MGLYFYLGVSVAVVAVAWIATTCLVQRDEPAGMDHVVREAGQWVLRRVIGARPKPPRHATTTGRGLLGGVR